MLLFCGLVALGFFGRYGDLVGGQALPGVSALEGQDQYGQGDYEDCLLMVRFRR